MQSDVSLLRESCLKMQHELSTISAGTRKASSSGESDSTILSVGPARKRRIRRQRAEMARRLVEAELMPAGTTSKDLPPGFGIKSPPPSETKSCECGTNKHHATDPKSSPSVMSEVSGLDQDWVVVESASDLPPVTETCDFQSFFFDPTIPPPTSVRRECDNGPCSFGPRIDGETQTEDGEKGMDNGVQTERNVTDFGCQFRWRERFAEFPEDEEWGLVGLFSGATWGRDCSVVVLDEETDFATLPTKWSRFKTWLKKRYDNQQMTLGKALAARKHAQPLYVICKTDTDRRWAVSETEEGDVQCILEDIPAVNTNTPGMTNREIPFDRDETRPSKVLQLSPFMQKSGLPFVDLELYYELKKLNINAGTSQSTYRTLAMKADVLLNQTRISHYEPSLMLEVKIWTVAAAMLPLDSELKMLKLIGNKKIFKSMNDVAGFKRNGVINENRFLGMWNRRHVLTNE